MLLFSQPLLCLSKSEAADLFSYINQQPITIENGNGFLVVKFNTLTLYVMPSPGMTAQAWSDDTCTDMLQCHAYVNSMPSSSFTYDLTTGITLHELTAALYRQQIRPALGAPLLRQHATMPCASTSMDMTPFNEHLGSLQHGA